MAETRLPIVTLTTDFGLADHYVAALKASILSVSTQIMVVDITHDIPAHDILEAGWVLRNAYVSFPRSTVHVAVTDPGVGMARRPILAVTDGHYFVGPDNGIFSFVFDADPPSAVFEITASHYMAPEVSDTFHARDVFGPVAARLARGVAPENFGPLVDAPNRADIPKPRVAQDGTVRATVAHVDRFGNVILNLTRRALQAVQEKVKGGSVTLTAGSTRVTHMFRTYGEAPPGIPFLLYNSSGFLEVAANRTRACDLVGLRPGDVADITFGAA